MRNKGPAPEIHRVACVPASTHPGMHACCALHWPSLWECCKRCSFKACCRAAALPLLPTARPTRTLLPPAGFPPSPCSATGQHLWCAAGGVHPVAAAGPPPAVAGGAVRGGHRGGGRHGDRPICLQGGLHKWGGLLGGLPARAGALELHAPDLASLVLPPPSAATKTPRHAVPTGRACDPAGLMRRARQRARVAGLRAVGGGHAVGNFHAHFAAGAARCGVGGGGGGGVVGGREVLGRGEAALVHACAGACPPAQPFFCAKSAAPSPIPLALMAPLAPPCVRRPSVG